MCGICGKIFRSPDQRVQADLIRRMADTLVHRGPDDEGYYVKNEVGLGHRRLKIIDLEGGKQPMFNEDGTLSVIFNGEIYNFRELRHLLRSHGHIFKTNSDTEVLLHGFEQWQFKMLDRLRGMFAFAIWNAKDKTLFIARDRMGKKPLYYYFDKNAIVFGSELKSLLVDESIPRNIDCEALDAYFALGYIPSPKTIYHKIFKLEPACYLLWKDGKVKITKYWDCLFSVNGSYHEKEVKDELLSKLEESVRVRLISDVPLGAFLSGGLDSSCVVALMSKIQNNTVVAASIGFNDSDCNELEFSRLVAEHCSIKLHEHIVTPDIDHLLAKLLWHFDEPFADSSAIPTYYVSKMARQHATVVLSGDGGDEIFAGYTRRYRFEAWENYWRKRIPLFLRKSIIRIAANLYPKADWLPQFLRAKTVLTNISLAPAEGYFNSLSIIPMSIRAKLYSNDFKNKLKGDFGLSTFRRLFDESQTEDPISRAQYVDMKSFLAEDVLVKVDRMSMANSLEVRSPLLDHEIVEFAATLPSNMKLNNGVSKYILKESMSELLPHEIIHRRKHGFEIPLAKWLRGELKELSEYYLFHSNLDDEILNLKYVRSIWQAHQNKTRDFSSAIWAILIYKLWYDKIYKSHS